MGIGITKIGHVNVTVPAALESNAIHFYGVVVGLQQIPKPKGTRQNVGAWYQLGELQLHLSTEDNVENETSDRHVCYQVADVEAAERHFRNSSVEVIPDPRPVAGVKRFYVRDPGGNLLEIAQGVQKKDPKDD
ncbi:MAG TPA: VOC family protein [Pyrinomonadaceae bacterium]|jgi:predicted enzyme related to lactoylglutathione lyase